MYPFILMLGVFLTTIYAESPPKVNIPALPPPTPPTIEKLSQRVEALEKKLDAENVKIERVLFNERRHERRLNRAFRSAVVNNDKPTVVMLLNLGVDVNTKFQIPWSFKGRTALHIAAEKGFVDLVKELIQRGANVQATDKLGSTPLHYAAWNGQKNTATELLTSGADVNAQNQNGRTPLDDATDQSHSDVVAELLKYKALIGSTIPKKVSNNGKIPLNGAIPQSTLDILAQRRKYRGHPFPNIIPEIPNSDIIPLSFRRGG